MNGQQLMAQMKARGVATFKLVAVPGRPEELREKGGNRGVSFGYTHGIIRLRTMVGREWKENTDFQIANAERGWRVEFDRILAKHLNLPSAEPIMSANTASIIPRRSNPQA